MWQLKNNKYKHMKLKIILLSFSFFLIAGVSFAQKNKAPKSIIPDGVAIKKYHSKSDLERMQKGELLVLYTERIESLIKLLPYIAFATNFKKIYCPILILEI